MKDMLDFADKTSKTSILNMFKELKKKIHTIIEHRISVEKEKS